MNNYNDIIKKLNSFIRKYHKIQLLKGLILSIALLVVFFLGVVLPEYFGQFDTTTRSVLFYSYLIFACFVLIRWILIPLLRIMSLGNSLSHEKASAIIGRFFPEIQDKLLNTLQLKDLADQDSSELIRASIDQKAGALKPFSFKQAVNYKDNIKYLKYVLPPLLVLFVIYFASPKVITGPAERIVNHNIYYEPIQDFRFIISKDSLQCVQLDDFTLQIETEGDKIPEEIFIRYNNNEFACRKNAPNSFSHTFRNMRESTDFVLFSGNIRSEKHRITVVPKAIITGFEAALLYPEYTGKQNETIKNANELTVPQGSQMELSFFTRDTEWIQAGKQTIRKEENKSGGNILKTTAVFLKDSIFSVCAKNKYLAKSDSITFRIHVRKDQYPEIRVQEMQDSIFGTRIYFRGLIEDDYGFSSLAFIYQNIDNQNDKPISQNIQIAQKPAQQEVYYSIDINDLGIKEGESIEYYFVVRDNDAINGPKASRSHKMIYSKATRTQADSIRKEEQDKVQKSLEKALNESVEIQKAAKELQKMLLQKKELSWQDKEQIQDLLKKQENLEKTINQLKEQNKINEQKEAAQNEKNNRLAEKQEELQKLFDELMNDEMKELFDKLEQMMEEINREKANDLLEQIQISDEELEEQLDRNMELLKQLRFESEMQKTIDDLEKLAQDQEELSKETEESKKNELGEISEEQKDINEHFDEIRKKMDELDEMNQNLNDPNDFDQQEQQQEEIEEELQESMEQLQQEKQDAAGKSQKQAGQKMKKMAQSMQSMMSMMQQQAMGEDIEKLREILENLIQLSFEQEELIYKTQKIKLQDPRYIEVIQSQNNLKEDLVSIEDSLRALAKRQMAIQPHVNKKMGEIELNIEATVKLLSDRMPAKATAKQQYVLTAMNDLALMLAEALDQMEDQQSSMQSSGQCNSQQKQGGGKPSQSMKSMSQLQEQLNQQLQEMQRQMEQQKQKGKGKQKPGGQSMSEQLARSAAQQQAIRKKLEEYMDEMKDQGLTPGKELRKIAEEMERTETDLVNKMITRQTLARQKEILTRLLKSEKAEREREKEEKRESRESKDQKISNPEEIFKYNEKRDYEREFLRTIPPELRPFYKKKANKYLYHFLD